MAAINQSQWLLDLEPADLAITIASVRAQTMSEPTLYVRTLAAYAAPGAIAAGVRQPPPRIC